MLLIDCNKIDLFITCQFFVHSIRSHRIIIWCFSLSLSRVYHSVIGLCFCIKVVWQRDFESFITAHFHKANDLLMTNSTGNSFALKSLELPFIFNVISHRRECHQLVKWADFSLSLPSCHHCVVILKHGTQLEPSSTAMQCHSIRWNQVLGIEPTAERTNQKN